MDHEDTLNTKQDSFLQHLALENLIHNSRSALNGDETAVAISSASDSAPSSDSSTTTSCSGLDLAEWWLNNRSCQICGNEFKSNSFKSRERQDHLAKEHYRARVERDLSPFFHPQTRIYHCPLCEFKGRRQQVVYSHYILKHRVVEKYLAEDMVAGRVKPIKPQVQD